jgi:hypothetical protein
MKATKTRPRKALIAALSLIGLSAVFLFGPSLLHRALSATTSTAELERRKSEWTRIIQLEPQALNGPNRLAFRRYSMEAFRWFRVRGMIDPTCEDTTPAREWRELFTYFFTGRGAAPPCRIRQGS